MLKIMVLKVVWRSGGAAAAFAREAGLEETREQNHGRNFKGRKQLSKPLGSWWGRQIHLILKWNGFKSHQEKNISAAESCKSSSRCPMVGKGSWSPPSPVPCPHPCHILLSPAVKPVSCSSETENQKKGQKAAFGSRSTAWFYHYLGQEAAFENRSWSFESYQRSEFWLLTHDAAGELQGQDWQPGCAWTIPQEQTAHFRVRKTNNNSCQVLGRDKDP